MCGSLVLAQSILPRHIRLRRHSRFVSFDPDLSHMSYVSESLRLMRGISVDNGPFTFCLVISMKNA